MKLLKIGIAGLLLLISATGIAQIKAPPPPPVPAEINVDKPIEPKKVTEAIAPIPPEPPKPPIPPPPPPLPQPSKMD